jgi:hypothetical protein
LYKKHWTTAVNRIYLYIVNVLLFKIYILLNQ